MHMKMYTKVCSVNFHMSYFHMFCFLPNFVFCYGIPTGLPRAPCYCSKQRPSGSFPRALLCSRERETDRQTDRERERERETEGEREREREFCTYSEQERTDIPAKKIAHIDVFCLPFDSLSTSTHKMIYGIELYLFLFLVIPAL